MKFKNRIEDPIPDEIMKMLGQKPFHIVITGDVGKGKSTLLKKLSASLSVDSGFITERVVGCEGIESGIYIHSSVSNRREYTKTNCIALLSDSSIKGNCMILARFPEVFNTLGWLYLVGSGLFIMDEIGFLERDSHIFLNRIAEIFKSDNSFIAVIKNKDIDYLNALKSEKGNLLITVGDDFTYSITS